MAGMDQNGFNKLMATNAPHIHEKILLSLDYDTFKNCRGVCKTWDELLDTKSFQEKAYTAYKLEVEMKLLKFSKKGNAEEVKKLLEGYGTHLSLLFFGKLLCHAAKGGHVAVVKQLLDAGADANEGTLLHGAPLQWAAAYGHLDVIRLLIERGADPYKEVDHGCPPPIDWARSREVYSLLKKVQPDHRRA